MRSVKALMVAVGIVIVTAGVARVRADDGDFVLRKPDVCFTATIWDLDYWLYSCYSF